MPTQQVVTFDELRSPDKHVSDAAWERLYDYGTTRVLAKMKRSHGKICHGVDVEECVRDSANSAFHHMFKKVQSGEQIYTPEGLFIHILETTVNGEINKKKGHGDHEERYAASLRDAQPLRNVSSQVHLQEQDAEVRVVIKKGLKSFFHGLLDRLKVCRPNSDVKSPLLQVMAIEFHCRGLKPGDMLDLVNADRPAEQQIKPPQISRLRDESARIIHECMVERGIEKIGRGNFSPSQFPSEASPQIHDYFGEGSPAAEYWTRLKIGCPAPLNPYSRVLDGSHQEDFDLLYKAHRDVFGCEFCTDMHEEVDPAIIKPMLDQLHASRASLYDA